MPITTEDALFRTLGGAMLFSLNYTHGQLPKSALAQLMGGGVEGKGLGGIDGAAQAGMIRAELDRLSPLRRAIIIARYSAPALPCACGSPCCRGYRDNPEWAEAIERVVEAVLMAGCCGTISHYRLRRSLVARYFGIRSSFVELAARCGINRDTASLYYKRMVEFLRREERIARYEIEGYLKEAGVVEG